MPRRKQAGKSKGAAPIDTSTLFPDAQPLPKLTDKNKIVKDKGDRPVLGGHRDGQAKARVVEGHLLLECGEQKGRPAATPAILDHTVNKFDNLSAPIHELIWLLKHMPKQAEEPDNNEESLTAVSEALQKAKSQSSNTLAVKTLPHMAKSGGKMLFKIREFGEAIAEDAEQEYRLRAKKLAQENKALKQRLAATNEYLVKSLHGSKEDERTVQEDLEIVQKLVEEIQSGQAALREQIADARDQLATARAEHRNDQDKIKAFERTIGKRDSNIAKLENNAKKSMKLLQNG